MKAIRRLMKIKDPKQIVLTNLPFSEGEEIEIVILGKESDSKDLKKLRSLLKETQSLPQIMKLSESEIEKEIEAYRSSL